MSETNKKRTRPFGLRFLEVRYEQTADGLKVKSAVNAGVGAPGGPGGVHTDMVTIVGDPSSHDE